MLMPTRSRGTSARTPKSPAPLAGGAPGNENRGNESQGNDNRRKEENDRARAEALRERSATAQSSDAQITGGSLERREIPSFSDSREQRIAEAAYWRAERRGFEPGHELDDWLQAEREIDDQRTDPSLDQRPDGRTA
jgi:hypothetical protein